MNEKSESQAEFSYEHIDPDDLKLKDLESEYDLGELNAMYEIENTPSEQNSSIGDKLLDTIGEMRKLIFKYNAETGAEYREEAKEKFEDLLHRLGKIKTKLLSPIGNIDNKEELIAFFYEKIREIEEKMYEDEKRWEGLSGVKPEEIGLDVAKVTLEHLREKAVAARDLIGIDIDQITIDNFELIFSGLGKSREE